MEEEEKEKRLNKIEIESLQSEKKVIISGLEEAKRKNINYENHLKKANSEISELKKRGELLEK